MNGMNTIARSQASVLCGVRAKSKTRENMTSDAMAARTVRIWETR